MDERTALASREGEIMAVAIDVLDDVLEETWCTIRREYDVTGAMPGPGVLFEGADLTDPIAAAERVVLNMLVEITERVGRFSPWYTMPARAFGILRMRDSTTTRQRWILATDAVQRWQLELRHLAAAIRDNAVVLEAEMLVDDLLRRIPEDDPCIRASCTCMPERSIMINRSVLAGASIVCSLCNQPFQPVETHRD